MEIKSSVGERAWAFSGEVARLQIRSIPSNWKKVSVADASVEVSNVHCWAKS